MSWRMPTFFILSWHHDCHHIKYLQYEKDVVLPEISFFSTDSLQQHRVLDTQQYPNLEHDKILSYNLKQ
jgi:hypothetical protein